MSNNERELERAGYDNWKLSNRDDEQSRKRSMGGWGTVEYEYVPEQPETIGKCPCCEEDILENEMWTKEEETLYHFQCYNYKIKAEEEEQENGK